MSMKAMKKYGPLYDLPDFGQPNFKAEFKAPSKRELALATLPSIPNVFQDKGLGKTTSGGDLPSSASAKAFLAGEPGGAGKLLLSTGLRSLLIAPGLFLVGIPWKKALLGAAISSLTISTFIIIYMSVKNDPNAK
jgi:hypothetical protein